MTTIEYRRMVAGDIPAVIELLNALRPDMAGLNSTQIYDAVCREAMRTPELIFVIGEREGRLVGVVAAVQNWSWFWKRLFIRNPLLGLQAISARAQRKLTHHPRASLASASYWRKEPPVEPPALEVDRAAHWQQTNIRIAKVVFIGVDEQFRGQRIALGLYRHLRLLLGRQGVERLDAMIEETNLSSLRLHERAGWQLRHMPGRIFATIALDEDEGEIDGGL